LDWSQQRKNGMNITKESVERRVVETLTKKFEVEGDVEAGKALENRLMDVMVAKSRAGENIDKETKKLEEVSKKLNEINAGVL